MEKIKIDSHSLHEYRGKIDDAVAQLKDQLKKTEQAIETVGEKWKDDNFREFQQNFGEDKDRITPLCGILSEYSETVLYELENKVRPIEDRIWNV